MSSNSVFINYRRSASSYLAQLVWRELTDAGIDAFYDINSIDAGQFDQIILNQIAARPYFMPILSPGTLERCQDPGDWVLREMQEALKLKRVIVPLVTEEFSFADFDKYLPADLAAELKRFNAMPVPPRFFKYAIQEVRERFLKPIDIPVIPTPKTDAPIVVQKQAAAAAQPEVTATQLSAQEYFERAFKKKDDDGDYDGAIADYTEAIRLNRQFAEAYLFRGLVHGRKGDLDSAIADCSQAILINPQMEDAYLGRGMLRNIKGDLDGAMTDSTQAIQLNPQEPAAYIVRGNARRDKGDFDGAITDFNQAIQLNPQIFEAFFSRGNAHGAKGDLAAAIADFTRAIQLNPQHAVVYYNRGIVRTAKGDLAAAIADFTQTIALNPQYANAYYNRGIAHTAKGDLDDAIADFTHAIQLNPQDASTYRNRGLAYMTKREMKQAAADYRRFLELQPNHPQAQALREFIEKHG